MIPSRGKTPRKCNKNLAKQHRITPTLLGVAVLMSTHLLTGCGSGKPGESLGQALGTDVVNGVPIQIPEIPDDPNPQPPPQDDPQPNPAPTNPSTPPLDNGTAQIGESCHSTDPNRLCLSLKYVVYQNSNKIPVISEAGTIANLKGINKIWSQCNIAFEIGEYAPVNPSTYGLNYNTSSSSELTSIRRAFEEDSTLLIVSTGTWSGSLGAGSANAWANLPGTGLYGVILEAPVADFSNIIAHEIGHYLNLGHYGNSSNNMNAVIYQGSTNLTSGQCSTARSAAKGYWNAMLR